MCGRFTQAYTWAELAALYRLTMPPRNLESRYNIAPTTTIDVVTGRSR
jgi:putative SOS response-associated peptidase YedK